MTGFRSLDDIKNHLARQAFGETAGEALRQGHCVNCKQPHRFTESDEGEGSTWTMAGRREIATSGICEHCFDDLFGS